MTARSYIYQKILESRKARIGLSVISGLGAGYTMTKLPGIIRPDGLVNDWGLITGVSGLMGGASYFSLARAANGVAADINVARAQAVVTGIFTGALAWGVMSYFMPHVPIVSHLVDTGTMFAFLPAFLVGVQAGHGYKDLITRSDLNKGAERAAPPKVDPVLAKQKRVEEYRQFLIERMEEKEERQKEESSYISRFFTKRLGLTAVLMGLYCSFDPHFVGTPDGIVNYIANNPLRLGIATAVSVGVLAPLLEKFYDKIGRMARKGVMIPASLTTLAILNGFDPNKFADVLSSPIDVFNSYLGELMKTPMLAVVLGLGYLKSPKFMNDMIFGTIPKVGKYAIKYAWDRAATARELVDEVTSKEGLKTAFIYAADNLGFVARYGLLIGAGLGGAVGGYFAGLETAHLLGFSRLGWEVSDKILSLEVIETLKGFGQIFGNIIYGGDANDSVKKYLLSLGGALGLGVSSVWLSYKISHGIEYLFDRSLRLDMASLGIEPQKAEPEPVTIAASVPALAPPAP